MLKSGKRDRFSVESHMVNCSLLAIAAALQLGIGDHESLLKLSLGAFLHDIGYARLPISPELDHLDLGNEAGALIRQHPLVGYDLLVDLWRSLTELPTVSDGTTNGLTAKATPTASAGTIHRLRHCSRAPWTFSTG